MKRSEIEALTNDPVALKKEIVRLSDIVDSHETAKRQRAAEEVKQANSPAANFEIDVFTVKSDIESVADGSVDILERGAICRRAVDLINRLYAALPKA